MLDYVKFLFTQGLTTFLKTFKKIDDLENLWYWKKKTWKKTESKI